MRNEPIPLGSMRKLGSPMAFQVVQQQSPVRRHCVLLPGTALEEGVRGLQVP
jgi:hypothetical protein